MSGMSNYGVADAALAFNEAIKKEFEKLSLLNASTPVPKVWSPANIPVAHRSALGHETDVPNPHDESIRMDTKAEGSTGDSDSWQALSASPDDESGIGKLAQASEEQEPSPTVDHVESPGKANTPKHSNSDKNERGKVWAHTSI